MRYQCSVQTKTPQSAAVLTRTVPMADIGAFIGESFGAVMRVLQGQHQYPSGPPFARYHMQGDHCEVSAGFPVPQAITDTDGVHGIELPGGTVVTTLHTGAYEGVSAAYEELMQWLPTQGLIPTGDPWEEYLDGPEVAQPRTVIHLPCAHRA